MKLRFDKFLIDFLNFITEKFQKTPYSTYLYQAEIVGTVFGESESH